MTAITGREAQPILRTKLPGPKARKIVKRDDNALMTSTKTAPLAAKTGRSVVVEDVDGNILLDYTSGIGVLNTGHCHPRVVEAIQKQAGELMHFAGTDFYYDAQASLAEELNAIVPIDGDSKVFYTNSGAESVEASIKIAKNATGRPRLMAFLGAFHGRTMGAVSLTASKIVQRERFFPTMPGVDHVPFPNPFRNIWGIDGYEEPQELTNRALDFIETLFRTTTPAEEVAGMFWEPVQGEGGYVVPPMQFPGQLQKLLDEHGILMVADEVQTGFGRTGKWFGSEHYGVKPDIMCLAKAMGSGLPIGAAVARAQLDFDKKGRHSNTYGGNLVACAGSLATLDVIRDEKLVSNSEQMGAHMGRRLDELVDRFETIGDHRGLGLMRAIEFVDKKGGQNSKLRDKVEEAMWKRGLVTLGCGASGIRFIPALTVTEEQIDGAMDILEESLVACKA